MSFQLFMGKYRSIYLHVVQQKRLARTRQHAITLFLLTAALISSPSLASAHPFRGQIGLSVLLCTFSDSPVPANPASFFQQMVMGRGNSSLADYWRAISQNGVDFDQAVVSGWHAESLTIAQAQAKSGGPNPHRGELVDDCVNAAKNDTTSPYSVPSGNMVVVITSPGVDMYGGGGRAFLPDTVDIGGLAHEIGHGLGLEHSYSDDPTYQNVSWAAIGEYDDPWDVMSYANVLGRSVAAYGSGGPSLNGYHLDQMGWLAKDRILTFGADGADAASLTLAPLGEPSKLGYLMIRVPFDPSNPSRYYTIEFRRASDWDSGIVSDIVLIHEIKSGVSYLLRERGGNRNPIQTLNTNEVRIAVNAIDNVAHQATITVSSGMAARCLVGYVWREANATDKVCVSGVTRQATWTDNAQTSQRRNPAGGAYGPDTCKQGFVWREAFTGDHVCVLPATRAQARLDNTQAANRQNPARYVYGPNTCKPGYVWRDADLRDYVCVSPAVRSQTQTDNSLAVSRRNPNGGAYGLDTCKQGYVWREAFPGDHVCVFPATRAQAKLDNAQASHRVA